MTYRFPLIHRQEVAEGTVAFTFDTVGSGFSFQAGQNCDVRLPDLAEPDPEGNSRTFSIASSPNETGVIMIATRMRATPFKNALKALALGTPVEVDGPYGNMTLHDDPDVPAVFIAGGIGITPFRSLIAFATEERRHQPVTLFYANRTRGSTAFLDELEAWARANPRFRFNPTLTDGSAPDWPYEHGPVTPDSLRRIVPDLRAPVFYLAGPPAMVEAMKKLLSEIGIPDSRIRSEAFTGY